MLRHRYERLEVTGDVVAAFDPSDADALERAVAHLGREAAGKQVWLRAVTRVKAQNYRWTVNALLTYEQVKGKSTEEIWRLLDNYTDKHIETVLRTRTSYPLV